MINTSREATRSWPVVVAAILAISAPEATSTFAQTPKSAAGKAEPQTKAAVAKGEPQAKPAAIGKAAPPARPTRANLLRGEYGPYRANNDLLYYHLDVRVDPEKQTISGKNTIRFRMLKDDTRIQLDLQPALGVDKILLGDVPLKFEREFGAVFVDFSRDVEGGPGLFHRLLLLGEAGLDGEVRRHGIPEGPGGPPLDLHVVRDARRQRLVAQQGPVARRGRVDGPERHDSRAGSWTSPTAGSSARRTWATATRAGTGT